MWKYFLAVVLIAAVTACGGAAGEETDALPSDPGEAMLQLTDYVFDGQPGRYWEHLHPAHQEIAARDDFIVCNWIAPRAEGEPRLSDAVSLRVIEVSDELIAAPRIGTVETKTVTIEVSLNEFERENTFNLVDVDGVWRWLMTDGNLDAFNAGECPQ